MTGPEFIHVEQPFIDQLVRMGWKYTTGSLDHPSATGRETFREVFIADDLRAALRRINLNNDDEPWLDDGRIDQATAALSRLGATKLLEANRAATELLVKGAVVDGVEGWDQGRGRTVHFIDWEHPENNTFRVVNQFKLQCPPGQPSHHIKPDLVLFVNGIPVVVVECKPPPGVGETGEQKLEEGIDQLQRYSNRRRELGMVDVNEGNERLFHYAQLQIATCFEAARVGTFSSLAEHYLAWKDTSPVPVAQVRAELGKGERGLSEQETLVAGMLRPAHLLDILRHFTLFMEVDGATVKVVSRYQQFRAVQRAVHRLLTGKTRAQDGEYDRRGGIIWHTQGSGKSLTMVFLVRKMRSDPTLRRFKVIVVTDRRDLEKQLSDTAALTNEVLTRVKAQRRGTRTLPANEVLQEVLRATGRDLVFAMIQKYRGELVEDEEADDEDDDLVDGDDATPTPKPPPRALPLPVLNTSEDILVLVDEAHRSHTNTAHANLMRALPNCAKIGFTGTPIIMRAKGQTAKIFGEFIDRYTIGESEADGATVKVLYEGRTAAAAVDGGGKLDDLFEDMLEKRSKAEVEAIKQKYATKGHVTEARALIAAKARDMLRHYVDNILPNGFKAQVVAVSRRAATRYYDAFMAARDTLVAEIEALDPGLVALSDERVAGLDRDTALLVRAHRFLPTIRALEFAPVISGEHNDIVDPERKWTTPTVNDARIKRFKKPLFVGGPNTFDSPKADPLAFLIVKSMLLTGFDAPVEQVMYLDRHIQEAELLQAIARVNRTYARGGAKKTAGIVVDYYGVARHLKEALAAYADEDVVGVFQSLKDEIPTLRDRHRRAVDVFTSRDVDDLDDTEACVELLRDDKVHAEFYVKLKQFLATLDLVLPRPEGLRFVHDAKTLAYIQALASQRYRRTGTLIGKDVGEKVRKLIDDHIISLGVNPKIPPVEITAADFDEKVDKHRSSRAKASDMEHALRYHIRKHQDEDPAHYEKLSARLQNILQEFAGQWDKLAKALKALVEEARGGRKADDALGLDPETEAPFFDVLKREAFGADELEDETRGTLVALTRALVAQVRQDIRIVGFWDHKAQAREELRSRIFVLLDDSGVLPYERLEAVADLLMELAKSNHHRLTGTR